MQGSSRRSARRAVLVATLAEALPADDSARAELLSTLGRSAEVLEVRADLVGDLDPALLRESFPGRLLYTLRSRAEGGAHEGSDERRHDREISAVEQGYDLVDLEAARDLVPAVLDAVPAERRVVSWHGPPGDLVELEELFEEVSRQPARLYKMIVFARQPGDAVAPLLLLDALGRDDLVAFAAGRDGAWSRLIAPYLGAGVVYAAATAEAAGAPGQLTVEELVRDYGLPELPAVERFFGIAGDPVLSSSLSPRLHNGAYRELGIPALYLPFECEGLGDFWLEVVESDLFPRLGLPLAGLSVTAPFKRSALAVAGAVSPLVDAVGAANTLVASGGVWEAECTDAAGVVRSFEAAGVEVRGCQAAVVGAGGAGRAAAVGLARAGAKVTLVNRGEERGRKSAQRVGLPFQPLADFDPAGFELLVNATPLGKDDSDPLPFAVDGLAAGAAVLDLVYREQPTRLVAAARAAGLTAVDGREMLFHQAVDQFKLMTGQELPVPLGRRLLGLPVAEPGGEEAS